MNQDGNFERGDVVRMLSGGPAMTVESINDFEPSVCCVWFDKNEFCTSRTFRSECLVVLDKAAFKIQAGKVF